MSRVFVAEETQLRRLVVVKVLSPELAEGISVERFQREILMVARLQHPQIVPVHAAGIASGMPYFTMPYIDGESVRQRVRRGPLEVGEVLAILRDVAKALAFAHAQGVVHRDIKPDNVLLTHGSAVVADFGIAKALSAARLDTSELISAPLTAIGVAVGTPAYMAPEQLTADPSIDHRADLYSFGCLAYEMLTGEAPFAKLSRQDVLVAHLTIVPDRVRDRRADVPRPLDDLVAQCLEKRPEDRPQSAQEVVECLDSMTTGSTRSTNVRTARASRWLRRPQLGAALVTGAIAATLVFAGYRTLRLRVRTPAMAPAGAGKRIAVLPFENVGHDTANDAFAEGMTDELTAALGRVRGVRLANRRMAFTFRDSSLELTAVGKRLGASALVTGSVQRSGGRFKVDVQLLDVDDGLSTWSDTYVFDTKDMLLVEDSAARAVVAALQLTLDPGTANLVVSGTRSPEAHTLYLQGMFALRKSSEVEIQRAVALFEKAAAKDSTYAAPWEGLARAWTNLADDWVAPGDAYPKVDAAAAHALALDPKSAYAHAFLGWSAFAYDWDTPRAMAELHRALELNPYSPEAHDVIVDVFVFLDQRDSALAHARTLYAAEPADVENVSRLFFTFLRLGILDSASYWLTREREMDPRSHGVSRDAAWLSAVDGRWADCVTAAKGTAALEANVQSLRAYCEGRSGDDADARRRIINLESERRSHYVSAVYIARAYAGLGDVDAAFRWLNQSLADRDGFLRDYLRAPLSLPLRNDPRYPALLARVAKSTIEPR